MLHHRQLANGLSPAEGGILSEKMVELSSRKPIFLKPYCSRISIRVQFTLKCPHEITRLITIHVLVFGGRELGIELVTVRIDNMKIHICDCASTRKVKQPEKLATCNLSGTQLAA